MFHHNLISILSVCVLSISLILLLISMYFIMMYRDIYRRRHLNKVLLLYTCTILIGYGIVYRPLVSPDVQPEPFFTTKNFTAINISIRNERLEALIAEDEKEIVQGLGEFGRPGKLRGRDLVKAEEIAKKEAFNLLLSNRIAYDRNIIDTRHSNCLKKTYSYPLPSASVIIIFFNERWSTLMRTIYSVINRTPVNILKEIILVDDASTHDELKDKLDYYIVTRLPEVVKLYRLTKRSGLIRAKLHGARQATSDVLIFLDAHCEVGIQWAEPLVARIKENRTHVVFPIIDLIQDKTLEYKHLGDSYNFQVGGFTWSGDFTWIHVSEEDKQSRKTPQDPTRSPTMPGGLFAIDRKYFWEIGSYDDGMIIWGGENLEMSFRVWQCGGIIEAIPCSRVGHIYRDFSPYLSEGNEDPHGVNTARTVKVWMDEYQRLFFLYRPDLKTADIGDISKRFELRKSLNCKPFSWYLKNVYKDKFIPDEQVEAYGRVRNEITNYCLDNLLQRRYYSLNLGLNPCHDKFYDSQYFSFSLKSELRREFKCAMVDPQSNNVNMQMCLDVPWQKWKRSHNGALIYLNTGQCLDSDGVPVFGSVRVAACNESKPTQNWTWDFYLI